MKKNLLYPLMLALAMLLTFHPFLHAEPVNPEKAATIAKHFYQSTKKGQVLAEQVNLQLVFGNQANHDLFYVFNVNDNAGFVIVAADDAVTPILGYSDSNAFDPANVPPNMQKWLEGYKHEIFQIVEHHIKATDQIKEVWNTLQTNRLNLPEAASVGPLLETTWNQSPFENLFCPGASPTGCVATAMAQIMYYWKYPAQGRGTNSYVENNYGTLSANFGSAIYQWGIMPWHPSTVDVNISQLMLHCGISVNMDYSPQGSGADPEKVAQSLIKYFKYDPNTTNYVKRVNYADAAWITLLKQELDASRPMHYRGTGTAGAHSFVCDGYDINNLFHFNWGWGGSSDGYFVIDALNPGSIGIGGGTGGFNTGQAATIGIQPDPTIAPELKMGSNLNLSIPVYVDGTPITVNSTTIVNTGAQIFSGFVSLALYDLQGYLMGTAQSGEIEYTGIGGAGALIDNHSFSFQGLPPGSYHAVLVYRIANSPDWIKIPDAQFNNDYLLWAITSSAVSLVEKPTVSPDFVFKNGAFDITASLINESASNPVFVGSVSADLHNLDGSWIRQIAIAPNQAFFNGQPSATITFHSPGLDVEPGTYRVVLWAKNDAINQGFTKVNVPADLDAVTFITILPAPLPPDVYEPNNDAASAEVMPLNFAGNTALVSTFNSDHHQIFDEDYYKIVFPSDPNFVYTVTGRLQDQGSSNNGGNYTNDCFWRYGDGINWSAPFDDELLIPGMQFQVQAGASAYFFVKPSFAGTVGTYLLELQITRMPLLPNDAPCGAIALPVNGVPQTGYSNQNATASTLESNLAPPATSCLTSWCDVETGAQIQHAMWFRFAAPTTGAVEVSTCALADFDTQLALYSASDCNNAGTYSLLAANDDGNGCDGYTSVLTKSGLTPGQTYYILVDGFEAATGNLGIKITAIQATAVQHLAATPEMLQVTPNPSSGLMTIQLKGQAAIKGLMVHDLSGKVLIENQYDDETQEITLHLSHFPNGVYMLQIYTGDHVLTQRIVIQQ